MPTDKFKDWKLYIVTPSGSLQPRPDLNTVETLFRKTELHMNALTAEFSKECFGWSDNIWEYFVEHYSLKIDETCGDGEWRWV